MAVIFVSRGTMSGVHLLMECLYERTGIRRISREDLEEVVNRHGEVAKRILERLDKATSAYDQFSELRWPYLVLMRNALLYEIRQDNVIYHGYSGHLLLPPVRHIVKVRIEAPLDLRVSMTMKRLGCDEKSARDYISEADDYRVKWARFMYGRDIRNSLLYDLTLNLGHMTLEAACGILECIMSEKDFQASSESHAEVERLYLATNVEVALITEPRTQTLEISAAVQDDGIELIGPYLEERDLSAVKEVAGGVAGVKNVRYSPGYAPSLEVNGHYGIRNQGYK
jgi:Cytidylate kinase-like family